MMDASGLLLLIFAVMSTSECSETAEPQCEDFDDLPIHLLEGEASYFVHHYLSGGNYSNEEFTWLRNNSRMENIFDENERIHCQGGALFLLNPLIEDSGFYTAQHVDQSGVCSNYNVKIEVLEASRRGKKPLLYGSINNSDSNKQIPCPHPVRDMCDVFGGSFTWYKDFNLLQGNHEKNLRVHSATKQHEGIYTCICTWTHNNKVYNSSGSRELIVNEPAAYTKVEILSPIKKEQFADEGFQIKLNCSVFCGINVGNCKASWSINGGPVYQMDGYNQTSKRIMEKPSKKTITTTILTIEKVSEKDFQAEFKCTGIGFYTTNHTTLSLKRRASMIPMVIAAVSVLFICVFAALLVKCFAIDLALFFRPYFPLRSHRKDTRAYDAYVVYQTQSMDRVTEDTLGRFVTQMLPSILEEKCGYRLFIHGRDDIPGEDRVELVEDSMTQSRRLMVILTPGSGSEVADQHPASLHDSVTGGFDWQVGLHHVLVQREMSVILIQLGETGPQGYTHLPIGLQHLIRKSAPVRWPESSRDAAACNSRFWKRVRYLMPALPAKKLPQSAVI